MSENQINCILSIMKLIFNGTRGYIDKFSDKHRFHSVLTVEYHGKDITFDCGADWIGRLDELKPHAIVVTHSHPDHVGGLKKGSPCPVYATETAWKAMQSYPIERGGTVEIEEPFTLRGITCEAFALEHSLRAPAVGYRVTAGKVTVFYAPDVVYIHNRDKALSEADLYIGDGATLSRSMVRKKEGRLFGHAPVRTQLTWCKKFGIPKAFVTHCGSEIVDGDSGQAGELLDEYAGERNVDAAIAYDGMDYIV